MKRINPIKLLKIIVCCVIAWACFIICMETGNAFVFAWIVAGVIAIALMYSLFKKLNKIIELLQIIADDKEDKTNKVV